MNRLLGIFTAGAMAIAMNSITWAADDRSGTDASRDAYAADLKKCDEITDPTRKQACVNKAHKDKNAQNDAAQGQTGESTADAGDDTTQGQAVEDGTANTGDATTQDQAGESAANTGDDTMQGQTGESAAAGDDTTQGQTEESAAAAGDDQQQESTAGVTGDQAGNADDEEYSAELKKCDALTGADKANCQATAKEKAGRM